MHPSELGPDALTFLAERHLATLSTPRGDGTVHVVPVGFSYDGDRHLARVITRSGSWKARRITAAPGMAVTLSQVDGGRWLSLEGRAEVTADPEAVAAAVAGYAARYREPQARDDRVAIEVSVTRILGRA